MAIISTTILPTHFGDMTVRYHQFRINYDFEACISISNGDITEENTIVRMHSSCLFSEALGSESCDCSLQLSTSMELIAKEGGVIVYLYQEGRGMGLANKIKSMELERTEHIDTAEAFKKLHFELDPRNYSVAIAALKELGVNKNIRLISNNPRKRTQLQEGGFCVVENVKLSYPINNVVRGYLKAKKEKLGHEL